MARGNAKKKVKRSGPLVAIDLGSSCIRAMAAERRQGYLHILGCEQINERDCIDRGIIRQSSDTGHMIAKVLRLLANRIGQRDELGSVFVAYGGRQMQSVPVSSFRNLGGKTEITASILEKLEKECSEKLNSRHPDIRVIALVPSHYVLDGVTKTATSEPLKPASRIEAHFTAFYMMRDHVDAIEKSFQQAGKMTESYFVRPETLLTAFAAQDGDDILSDGVAVLDLGAQTTTLSIFRGTQYVLNRVVAQGSEHITRLIAQQGFTPDVAEVLKVRYGFASGKQVSKNRRMRVPALAEYGGELVLTTIELAELIQTKLNEIFTPLLKELTDHADSYRYVYVTGGGALLGGLIPWLQDRVKAEVRGGDHFNVLTRDTSDEFCSPRYTSLVGALLLGADWRERHPDKQGNFMLRVTDFMGNVMGTLFNDED